MSRLQEERLEPVPKPPKDPTINYLLNKDIIPKITIVNRVLGFILKVQNHTKDNPHNEKVAKDTFFVKQAVPNSSPTIAIINFIANFDENLENNILIWNDERLNNNEPKYKFSFSNQIFKKYCDECKPEESVEKPSEVKSKDNKEEKSGEEVKSKESEKDNKEEKLPKPSESGAEVKSKESAKNPDNKKVE